MSVKKNILVRVILLVFAFTPAVVFAQWNVGNAPGNLPDAELPQIVRNITNWALGFATGLSVLILIWGGILYLTASGDENQVEDARNIIRYAMWGLVIIGISYAGINTIVSCWINAC